MAEKKAVALYSRMLTRLKSEQLKDIISRILQDEKLHLEKFEEILQGLKR